MKKVLVLTLAALLTAAMALGCAKQPVAAEPGGAPPAPAVEPGAEPAAPAEGEKVFRYARSWEEASWDPALFGQADDVELAMVIFETLLEIDKEGKIHPALAESYEESGDHLTYTFHLRKGVQFHGGYGELKANDVKFTWERHKDPAVGSKNVANLNLENISAIETPDDYTVVFKLAKPDVDFLTRCALYYSYILCEAHYKDVGLEGMVLHPIGTGPFMYDSGTPMTHTEAVRFDGYWGEKAKIDRITNTIIADATTGYTAMENGELEAIAVYDIDKAEEFAAKGFNVVDIPYMELLYVSSNPQNPPFDNPKVREAMFAAIDPQYFIDQMFHGTTVIPGSYVPAASKYAVTDYFKPTYDPERAKALLAEAGYPDGVTVTLWAPNDALSTTPAIIVQSQLAEAGFNVELQLVDFGVFADKVRNGETQLWLLYNTTPVLADETISRYTSDHYPGSNWSGIVDAEYDKLVAAGFAATTEAEKADYFAQAQKRLMDLQVLYPISTHNFSYVTKPGVDNYYINFDGLVHLDNVTID